MTIWMTIGLALPACSRPIIRRSLCLFLSRAQTVAIRHFHRIFCSQKPKTAKQKFRTDKSMKHYSTESSWKSSGQCHGYRSNEGRKFLFPQCKSSIGNNSGIIKHRPTKFACRACERSVSGAENGAERPENRVERSGAVSGRGRKTVERSGARSGRSRSGNGAGSGGYRIRLERGAAFSMIQFRSHESWVMFH